MSIKERVAEGLPEPVPERLPGEEPLPATLTFVLLMGVTFVVLWFGLFAMLKARW